MCRLDVNRRPDDGQMRVVLSCVIACCCHPGKNVWPAANWFVMFGQILENICKANNWVRSVWKLVVVGQFLLERSHG